MKILNLVNKDTSDIKFEVSNYPDGQRNITIDSSGINQDVYKGGFWREKLRSKEFDEYNPVQLKSRLNNFQDLEIIIAATQSLRNLRVKEIHLYTPYFLGSRSDRQFEEGSNNYLKQVICPIINSLNFESVTVLDPHSYVLEACLNNFKKRNNYDLVRFFKEEVYGGFNKFCAESILISPDSGASHKIYKLAKDLNLTQDIITCSKERDNEGKLTEWVVPINYPGSDQDDKDFIIIDDICDGGATFINIAKGIRERNDGKIYLIVTHGIFSKGFKELAKYFDGIYCTNSYSQIYPKGDILYNPFKPDSETGFIVPKDFIKQLNVF